jgi:hypothetical protein
MHERHRAAFPWQERRGGADRPTDTDVAYSPEIAIFE